tara:strand:- start:71 stop:295 length:225 start_codon:yes stop_codon:yes gene_type:complete
MKLTKKNISFEIKICAYEDKDENYIEHKGKKSMVINDIEYYRIKKFLENEYGLMTEFDELDKEIKQIESEGLKK